MDRERVVLKPYLALSERIPSQEWGRKGPFQPVVSGAFGWCVFRRSPRATRRLVVGQAQPSLKDGQGSPQPLRPRPTANSLQPYCTALASHHAAAMQSSSASACQQCGSVAALHACSRCRLVVYCGRSCQKLHWSRRHKLDCMPRTTTTTSTSTLV